MSSSEAADCQQQLQQQQLASIATGNKKKLYLLISNPSKTAHLGTLLRCAAAFQVHQVLLVGYDKFNCQGSFGSHLFLDIVVFPTWESVHDYLRRGGVENDPVDADDNAMADSKCSADEQINPITIMGILGAYSGGDNLFSQDGMSVYEDSDTGYASLLPPKDNTNPDTHNNKRLRTSSLPHRSFPINTRQFSSDVCFVLSKDKCRGLPLEQARLCSGFVHLPLFSLDDAVPEDVPQTNELKSIQSSAAPTQTTTQEETLKQETESTITQSTLLETAAILSTVLHHYTAWARYSERSFTAGNQKFVKDVIPNYARRRKCRVYGGGKKEKKQEIEKKKEKDDNAEEEAMGAMMLFGDATKGSDY